MKAIGYYKSLPIEDTKSLVDIEIDKPVISDFDLLIEVKAISVNPIDYKRRRNFPPKDGQFNILGFDGSGIVIDKGDAVKGFERGDAVYYAGTLQRQGSNAQYQAIDYRIVAHKPQTLDFSAAASIPLTALTAWEMLFERLRIECPIHSERHSFLMNGAAGGVGSLAIQLAKLRTNLTVIATASRAESVAWVKNMGAEFVINYKHALKDQLFDLGFPTVDYIFSTAGSADNRLQFVDIISPQGRLGLIDDPQSFDILPFKGKSVSIHWESMFTRSLYATDDLAKQGEILAHVGKLFDERRLKITATQNISPINAKNLRQAHKAMESGQHIGKFTLTGF